MDFSLSKGSSIERLTHYPHIGIKELARALTIFDPNLRNDELPKDKKILSVIIAYI